MQITFWGTRGSIAKAGPGTVKYGGNTSCVEVRSASGTLIVLDCGTGAHGLGEALMAEADGKGIEGHLLITHTHWDHIQGLPFFAPLFDAASRWTIYGPSGLGSSIGEVLAGQMQYNYFPVSIDQLESRIEYHDLVEGVFTAGDVRVVTRYLHHPALTLGYRLECDGASVVYASDHEPHDPKLAGGGQVSSSSSDIEHAKFVNDADLLIHDAQYLAGEYPNHTGWGHSTVEYAVDTAHIASVRTLALYHHEPSRDDEQMDALVDLAVARAAGTGYLGEVIAAKEGTTIELGGDVEPRPVVEHDETAKAAPLAHQLPRSLLLVAPTPRVAEALWDAAIAEGLDVFEARSTEAALDMARTFEPGIVLVESGTDRSDPLALARALRNDPELGDKIAIVAIGPTRPSERDEPVPLMTEWLVWPSSSVFLRTKLRAWVLRQASRWQNAPLPLDEERRIKSLRDLGILDTEPERRFDQYTELASRTFDVPIALVSLVDADRQWFKSKYGIDATETPRDHAFCAHAIHEDEVFQVPDAMADQRFADNPLVVDDPRVRFYAGVPLRTSDGSRVGTLCVIDHRPRLLDDGQLADLQRLGKLVEEEFQASPQG